MVQKHQSTLQVLLRTANSVQGSFFFGYALSYLNVSLNTINVVFDIAPKNVLALLPLGACVGAFLSGPILDQFTRRYSLMITDLISIIGLAIGEIVSLPVLCISRILIGLAVGLNSALIPLYIQEFTPMALRATAGSMNQITINIGVFVALLIGFGYPANNDDNSFWRYVFILPVLTSVGRSTVLLLIFKDDPPGYYVSKNETTKAVQVLKTIYVDAYVDERLKFLQTEESHKKQNSQTYADIFTERYKNQLIVGCLLSCLQQFCGINAVIFYSSNIFKQITTDSLTINLLNIGVGLTNIVFSMLAGVLMRTVGRKPLLIVGDAVCCFCLLMLSASVFLNNKYDTETYQFMIVAFLYLFLVGFQLSLGPITWIYLAEILPEKGLSLAILVNWICVFIVTLVFPILNSAIGIQYSFLIFSGFCFLGIFYLIFLLKETKDRNAGSIDALYYQLHSPDLGQNILNRNKSINQ